jgi:hypothetical protein
MIGLAKCPNPECERVQLVRLIDNKIIFYFCRFCGVDFAVKIENGVAVVSEALTQRQVEEYRQNPTWTDGCDIELLKKKIGQL